MSSDNIFVVWFVQVFLFGTGAALKKLTGRPITDAGYSEALLGGLFYVALFAAYVVIVSITA